MSGCRFVVVTPSLPATPPPLSAEEEAEGRARHLHGTDTRFPNCVVCRLFATLDAERIAATARVDGLRLAIEGLRKHEPWPQFGFVGSALDVRNGYNGAIDAVLDILDGALDEATAHE